MFRAMRRFKQQLSQEECIAILKNEVRGVLSVLGDDDYPYGVPLDYYYSGEDGHIYFHGAGEGHKIDSIKKHDKVSFCVYDEGFRKESDWALNIKSVIVFGHIEFIDDVETIYRISAELSHKFTNDEDYISREIARSGPRTLLFALVPDHISGKLVNES